MGLSKVSVLQWGTQLSFFQKPKQKPDSQFFDDNIQICCMVRIYIKNFVHRSFICKTYLAYIGKYRSMAGIWDCNGKQSQNPESTYLSKNYFTVHFLYVTLLSCTFYYIVRRWAKSCQWDFSCSFNLAVVDLDDAPTPSWLKRRKMESFLATDNQLTRAFVNSTKTRSAVRRRCRRKRRKASTATPDS